MRIGQTALLGASTFLLSQVFAGAAPAAPASFAEHQAVCAGKDGWSDPAPPIRIFANIYDIGTCGIVVLLVAGPAGHVVIDAATAEAVPSIVANIQRLGFRPSDVKLLLSSHEHLDHAGGLHELQRLTGAKLIATAASRRPLESGVAYPKDPQKKSLPGFVGAPVSRVVRDGEAVQLGSLRLTAHTTPGHAPGSTSWTWRSCEGKSCHDVVYADSLSAVAASDYRFADHPAYVATFRASMAKVASLPCDLLVTPHPAVSDFYERLAGTKPLADKGECAAYADASRARLDARLAGER